MHFGSLTGISGLLELGGHGTTVVMVGTAAKSEGGFQRPAGLLDEKYCSGRDAGNQEWVGRKGNECRKKVGN